MSDDETPQEPLPRGYELELIDPTDPNVVIPHSLAFTSRLGDGGQGSIYGCVFSLDSSQHLPDAPNHAAFLHLEHFVVPTWRIY